MVENEINIDNSKVNLILDAAQKRFAYYGLAKTTMTEIAQDAGMSKASLYYYFTDKDALFKAVLKREQDGFLTEMKKLFSENANAQNKIIKYAQYRHEYFMKIFINLGKLKMPFETVKPLVKDLLDDFFKSEVALVSEVLNEGIANSEFEKIDVPMHADLFVASMNGLRALTIKDKDYKGSNILEQSDFDEIAYRTNNLASIFIKGILKK